MLALNSSDEVQQAAQLFEPLLTVRAAETHPE
jgi:hypothetical protein